MAHENENVMTSLTATANSGACTGDESLGNQTINGSGRTGDSVGTHAAT